MIVLPTRKTPVLCQGLTSVAGATHTELAIAYGSRIVAGTGRDDNIDRFLNIPVFSSVKEAVRKTKPLISVIFFTPTTVSDDVQEAIKARIPTIICTTEHVPAQDILKMKELALKYGVHLIGPSSLGIVRTGDCLIGNIPAHLFPKGNIGLIGRSSSLIYEAIQQLAKKQRGVSVCVSLGAGELMTTSFIPVIQAMMKDNSTKAILAIGQLYGQAEFELADYYKKCRKKKPSALYIPGKTLFSNEKMPILGTNPIRPADVITQKQTALNKAGIRVIYSCEDLGTFFEQATP